MAESVIYIVDDQNVNIEYLCPSMHQNVLRSFYKKTWTTIASPECADGWFKHTFHGTRVKISASLKQWGQGDYSAQLDDGDMLRETGAGAYDSGILDDGEHTVIYGTGNDTLYPAFDYLTIAAGPSTAMRGRTVMVDDSNSAIQWSGTWSTTNLTKTIYDYSSGPYLDTVHWTKSVGDHFKVTFVGDSVAVYGIVTDTGAWGNFSLEYSIDNGAIEERVYLHNSTAQIIPMAQLFQTDLDAGNHVLSVNVTSISNAYPVGIDFVAYNASYDSLADLLKIDAIPSSPASAHKGTHVGAIVGGVVGGIIFVALVGLFFYVSRKRAHRKQRTRAAASTIGRSYNPQLDIKRVVPSPSATVETIPMPTLQFERDRKTGLHDL